MAKSLRYLIGGSPYYRAGVTYAPGSIVEVEKEEDASRTWTQLDDKGMPIEKKVAKKDDDKGESVVPGAPVVIEEGKRSTVAQFPPSVPEMTLDESLTGSQTPADPEAAKKIHDARGASGGGKTDHKSEHKAADHKSHK